MAASYFLPLPLPPLNNISWQVAELLCLFFFLIFFSLFVFFLQFTLPRRLPLPVIYGLPFILGIFLPVRCHPPFKPSLFVPQAREPFPYVAHSVPVSTSGRVFH